MLKFLSLIFLLSLLFFLSPQQIYAGDVAINEFFVDASVQWVELYNKGTSPVDISGWFIDDNGGTQKYTIPSGTTINSSEFKVFESGLFNLNKTTPDTINFLDGLTLEDSFSYETGPGINNSYGRQTDGIGNFVVFTSPTKGSSNNTSSPAPTSTPIPTPTPTPSPIPTPSPTPVPTTTSTSTPKPTTPKPSTPKPTTTSTPIATSVSVNLVKSEKDIASNSVLSESSPSSKLEVKKSAPSPKLKTKVASENNLQKILIVAGLIFIISSGFWLMKSLKKNE